MSIVALKRKSKRYQAPISGNNGFSINGTLRNQGWVGQGILGRTLVGTPFRGSTPRGAGGYYGKYTKNIINNGDCCVNNPSTIKRSNMNTAGYIDTSITHPTNVFYQKCNNTCNPNIVKNFSPEDHSQGSRIEKLARQNSKCIVLKSDAGLDKCYPNCTAASYHIGGKKIVRTMYSKNLNSLPVSSSQYQRSGLMATNNLPTPPCKKPFPISLSHNKGTCQINTTLPEEAINFGILPSDWMNCNKCTNSGTAIKLPKNSQNINVQTNIRDYSNIQFLNLSGQYIK